MKVFDLNTLTNKLGTQVSTEVKVQQGLVQQNFKSVALTFNTNDCQEHYLIFKDKIIHMYWDDMHFNEDKFVISASDFDLLFTSVLKTLGVNK